jgi:hypothetical protein
LALLTLGLIQWGTGWAIYNETGAGWLENVHEFAGNAMLAVVGIHIAGVLLASRLHKENLVRPMVTGRKHGLPSEGISRDKWSPLIALFILTAVVSYWTFQWVNAPQATPQTSSPRDSAKYELHDKDD